MLGLILAEQSVLLVGVHLVVLALARALGERKVVHAEGLVRIGRLVALSIVVAVAILPEMTGHRFLIAQLVLFSTLAATAAIAPRDTRVHVITLHVALFALLVRFLVWRGLYDAQGATPVLSYVFQDFAAQLLLPSAGAVHEALFGVGDAPFLMWLRASVQQAAAGVATHIVLLGALTTHAVAVVTVRAVTSRAAPSTLAALVSPSAVPGVIVALMLAAALPSVHPILRIAVLGAILPALVFEALALIDTYAATLRSGRLVLVMIVAVLPFAPVLLHVLGALGALFALRPSVRHDDVEQIARVPLLRWTVSGLVAAVGFGLIAGVSGYLLSPARALPPEATFCANTGFSARDDGVLVTPTASTAAFVVDIVERPLGAMSVAQAEGVCATEQKRLCSSRELFMVCACDHGEDGYGSGAFPMPREGLVARARCHEGGGRECVSEHGVRDLLGGRSELTSTTVAHGGHLVAGANDWLRENWMVHCRWRGVMSDESIEAASHPMLGYRCCVDAE